MEIMFLFQNNRMCLVSLFKNCLACIGWGWWSVSNFLAKFSAFQWEFRSAHSWCTYNLIWSLLAVFFVSPNGL